MDVVQSLRRQDFPECTRMALDQLTKLLMHNNSGIPGLGAANEDLAEQMVSEFVFGVSSLKSRQIRKFTALQELQLVEVILQYFAQQKDEVTRHSVFKAVFSWCFDNELKLSVLTKVISMAIGVQNANLLNSAATWMQSQGCNSDVITVIASVIQDYCGLAQGSSISALKDLPKVSIHFTCTMMTAVTYIYSLPEVASKKLIITCQLLEQMIEWMTYDPRLALTSIHQTPYLHSQRQTLWTSPTKPNTQTPIPGLVRWCTKAPLIMALHQQKRKTDDASGQISKELEKCVPLWTKLHFSILQTILQFPSIPGASQLELITLSDMMMIVKDVSFLVQHLAGGVTTETTETAVDRLVQVLQVALATGAFRCSLGDLRIICQTIPPCRLLTVVQNQHLSFAPPPMHNAS